ncbi:MAG: hypothetical protein F4Y76_02985 [Acidimicrobiales bacterium]|nr:hypothetical protein [Acidimicrobiales bacterium]MYG60181.1 hypothetical protein [Acidimicrobiales bacterium]MYJ46447.1 hypothetical protein [Acidimicrobiales bacterium]
MSFVYCSSLIDEWDPTHRQIDDGALAVATDDGGEGRIDPVWSAPIIERLIHNGHDETVELSYPSWLAFLNCSVDCVARWPDLREINVPREVARGGGLGRLLGRLVGRHASSDSATRNFKTDVLTAVELFQALAAWRDPNLTSVLYERHGVQSIDWARSVACVSCPAIWIVTDPELPLTLISDRSGMYEALEAQRRLRPESNSTAIVRNAQHMTIDECIAALYSGRDIDWMP